VKAVRFHEHGGPDVLRYEEVDDPIPRDGEALVRVRACALNHLDLWQRRGLRRVAIPLPHISGADVAGEVASGPLTGQRVLLQPGLSCGRCEACLSGRDNFCSAYDVLGYQSDGGYAELVRVPQANLVPIPDHVDLVEAAAFPLTFLTAWHMLAGRARVRPSEVVLVVAAGSGVGQAAVQLARVLGAKVIATAGSEAKLARARDLGAEWVIHHYDQDIAQEVTRITGRRGVDVVIEHVGQAVWATCVRSLARGGRLVTCGATSGAEGSIELRVLFSRQLSLLGSYMGSKGELLEVARLFFDGRVRPVVDRVLPLAEAGDAQRALEAGEHFGKVVLGC
jgi:NADPH:quinone reductase-like Zn-dependent oxidoreductase